MEILMEIFTFNFEFFSVWKTVGEEVGGFVMNANGSARAFSFCGRFSSLNPVEHCDDATCCERRVALANSPVAARKRRSYFD